jgi:hypothetical protein
VLDALIGLAHLQAQAGEAEQALELSVCVAEHIASTQQTKGRAGRLRAEIESRLSSQQVEAATARARSKTLETAVSARLEAP